MRATKENVLSFLKDIKTELQHDGIKSIALFGSFARGDESVYSDIDIAIQKEENYLQQRNAYAYFNEVAKIKSMIQHKFHRNSDVFDLDSDSSFKQSILKELIYV